MNMAILSINIYLLFSILFFVFKNSIELKSLAANQYAVPTPLSNMGWVFLFLSLSAFIIAVQNYAFSSYDSGGISCKPQIHIVLIYTLAAVALVLCPVMYFIIAFNWNRFFANTFGLLLLNNLDMGTGTPEYFYRDPNILLQEIETIRLFDLQELNGLLKHWFVSPPVVTSEIHKQILNQYITKQNVGYFTWLCLTGIIASLISTNSILTQDCSIE